MWMAALFRGGTPRSLPIFFFSVTSLASRTRATTTCSPEFVPSSASSARFLQKFRFRLLIASRDPVSTLYRRNRGYQGEIFVFSMDPWNRFQGSYKSNEMKAKNNFCTILAARKGRIFQVVWYFPIIWIYYIIYIIITIVRMILCVGTRSFYVLRVEIMEAGIIFIRL